MCTIRTNAFKKFPLEDRALARKRTREGERAREGASSEFTYALPASFSRRLIPSGFVIYSSSRLRSDLVRGVVVRHCAFRLFAEPKSYARSLTLSFVRSLCHRASSCFLSFYFFLFFSFSPSLPLFRSSTPYYPPPPLFSQISTRPSIS